MFIYELLAIGRAAHTSRLAGSCRVSRPDDERQVHHLRRRRGHRQVDPGRDAGAAAGVARDRRAADARARRFARRRNHPPRAAVRRGKAARRRKPRRCCLPPRATIMCSRPSCRRSTPANGSFATASPIPRASIRAFSAQVDPRFITALERVSDRRSVARPDAGARRAGRSGIEARSRPAARRHGPTASKPRTSIFTRSCARPIWRWPRSSRDAASSSTRAAPKKMVAQAHLGRRATRGLNPGAAPAETGDCGLMSARRQLKTTTKRRRRSLTSALFGHAGTEAALLAAYRSGRVPHAFLLIGQKGIGKATLAYRLARFVLAHPDPAAPEVQAAASLAVDAAASGRAPDGRAGARRSPVLERTPNEKGVLRQQIAVEDVRRTMSFFGSTAGEGGWRIAIVDAVDELNRFGANALLKVLEEPPRAHAVAAGLPFRRARAADVALALPRHDHAAAWRRRTSRRRLPPPSANPASDPQIAAAAAAADGSVARALAFLDEDALALRQRALGRTRSLAGAQCRARCTRSAMRSPASTRSRSPPSSIPSMPGCRSGSIAAASDLGRLAQLAEAWERINQAARDAAEYNLERKPLVFSVFGLLAEATRG